MSIPGVRRWTLAHHSLYAQSEPIELALASPSSLCYGTVVPGSEKLGIIRNKRKPKFGNTVSFPVPTKVLVVQVVHRYHVILV